MADTLKILEDYIAEDNPKKWSKLASDIQFRRLQLLLLKEILVELKKINKSDT